MKSGAYQDIVQPQAEYAAETWNPYNIITADRLEQIQCAAARFVHHDYQRTTSVCNLIIIVIIMVILKCYFSGEHIALSLKIIILGWDRLHTSRLVSQLTMFYEIHYHLVIIQIPWIISSATYICKHDHRLKYAIPVATMDSYKFSFYPRSIRLWNQLPSKAIFSVSLAVYQVIALPVVIGV